MLIQPTRRHLIKYGIGAAAFSRMARAQMLQSIVGGNSSTGGGGTALTFVQYGLQSTGGTGVNSRAVTLTTTAGNLLFIAGTSTESITQTIGDTAGETFTLVPGLSFPISNGSPGAQYNVWYVKNCQGGSNTITLTYSASSEFSALAVLEYSGGSTSAPYDTGAHTNYGSGTSGDNNSSGSFTTAQANELILGVGNEGATGGMAASPGYTLRLADTNTGLAVADRTQATAASTDAKMQLTASVASDVFGFAFKS